MVWRGASIWVAFPVFLLASGGSTMHYLARPHIFTLVFLLATLWLLDSERRAPSRRIWLLVPLTLLWTNLHGGWPVVFVFLGLQIFARLFYRDPLWRRELAVAALCALATLVNPYGWHLHHHILGYLDSDWIRNSVDEFQSPKFRAENLLQFEVLLIAGIAAAWGRAFRGLSGLTEALAVWLWAHLALGAVRHAPLYLLAAAPVVASELTLPASNPSGPQRKNLPSPASSAIWTATFAPNSPTSRSGSSCCPSCSGSPTPPASLSTSRKNSSPSPPSANRDLLAAKRVYASDQWGDYLLYKLWPGNRVFLDGRSDFYGPDLGKAYLAVANVSRSWQSLLDKHLIEVLLLPRTSDLAAAAERDSRWQIIHSDTVSVIPRAAPQPSAAPAASHLFSLPD